MNSEVGPKRPDCCCVAMYCIQFLFNFLHFCELFRTRLTPKCLHSTAGVRTICKFLGRPPESLTMKSRTGGPDTGKILWGNTVPGAT